LFDSNSFILETNLLVGYIEFIMDHEKGLTSTNLMRSLSTNTAGEGGIPNKKMSQTAFIEAFILGHHPQYIKYLTLSRFWKYIRHFSYKADEWENIF